MKQLPQHIAIIMDGNGRWAEMNHLPRIEGHARGVQVSEKIITACLDRGIRYLTLYTFSEENWNRPSSEVDALMTLLQQYLIAKRPLMLEKGIRFRTIGDTDRLPALVQEELITTKEQTAGGFRLDLIMALSYGARQEICRAVNALLATGKKAIAQEELAVLLDTASTPDPDLLIRTGGEHRISNFLLWQLAYTELYFTDVPWPSFSADDLDSALDAYSKRERRFGLTSEQLKGFAG